jgi:uncharacterized metal-binding protein YceD (DUF177 family)
MIARLEDMKVRLADLGRERRFAFQPDEATRAEIAKTLGLIALPAFSAIIDVSPWLDGVELRGVWKADVVQTCGVSLEEFATPLASEFVVRAVPAESPNAVGEDSEVVVDPEADDPPDVLEGDTLDLGGYAIEHLGLEIDPFPRKPGAVFEPPQTPPPISPFAALRDLKS